MDQNFNLNGQEDQANAAAAVQDTEGMVFNLSDVNDEVAFEVLPKGTYNAIVEELEYTTSQSSGDPMIRES